jgi:hypothetical protein
MGVVHRDYVGDLVPTLVGASERERERSMG